MSKRFGVLVAMVTCWVAFGGGRVASAQEDAMSPFDFKLEARVDITDNVDYSPDGFERDNVDVLLKPRIDYIYDTGDSLVDIYYIPIFRYRSDPSPFQDEFELFHDFGLHIRHAISPRFSVRLRDYFKLTDNPNLDSGGINARWDGTYFVNSLRGGVSYDVARNQRLDLDAIWRVKEYDESVFDYLDEDSLEGELAYRVKVSRTSVLLAQLIGKTFEYGEGTVIQEDIPGAIYNRDFDQVSGGGGVESQFREDSKASLYVGYTQITFDDEVMPDQDSPYASVIVKHNPNPAVRLTGSAAYGLRESAVLTYAAQTYSDIRGDIEWDAAGRWTFGLLALFRHSEYEEDAAPPEARMLAAAEGRTLGGDEDTIIAAGSIAYKLTEEGVLKLVQRYEKDDSDVTVNYTKNTTSISYIQSF